MANPRLPPPDDAMDRPRPTSTPNREPRLSLREATQQARAIRRAGSGAGGAAGHTEASTSGAAGGGSGDAGGGTGRGGGSSGGGGSGGGGGKPRSRLPSKSSMVCLGLAGLHGLLRWQAWLVYRLQPAFRLPLSWRWIDCPR